MAGSYLKSLQLAKQLEKKAKEASKKKADAETTIQVAETIRDLCKSINAEVDEIEKAITEAAAALGSKDYDQGHGKAEEAVDIAKKAFAQKIESILDDAKEIKDLISELRGDTDQVEKLISDTKAALDKDAFEDSIRLAEQTWDTSQKALHEHYGKAYSQAQQMLLKAKEMGEEIEDLDKELRDTKRLIESEDHSGAMTVVKRVLEAVSDLLRSRISSDLDSIEDDMISAEDMGADIARIKNSLSKARDLLEARDFDEAITYARKAQKDLDKNVSGRLHQEIRKLKEAIRTTKKHGYDVGEISQFIDDASKAVKEREISSSSRLLEKARDGLKEAQFQIVLRAIAKSRDRFVLAKKVGADISGAITLLNESREKLRKGHFEEALSAAEEAEKEVDNALSSFNNAKANLETLTTLMESAEEIGLDISKGKKYFQEAKKAFGKKDFAFSNEKAEAGIELVKGGVRKATEEQVGNAENIIAMAAQLNSNVSEAQQLLRGAYDKLDELNPVEAYRQAEQSIKSAKESMHKLLEDRISSIDSFLETCSKSFDITEYKTRLDKVRELFESPKFVEAFNEIDQVKQELQDRGAEESKRLLGDAEIILGEIEAAGTDASDLRLMISKAEEQFKKGEYENAVATAEEAISDANSSLEGTAKKTLYAFKKLLEEARTDAINTAKWRSIFKQARKMLESGEISSSYQMAKKAIAEMTSVSKQRKTLLTKIGNCDELLEEAKKNKVDLSGSAADIKEAKKALESLDTERAASLIGKAEREIEDAMAMYLAAKLIFVLRPSVEFAEREELDMEVAKSSLEKAKKLMKKRDYEEALTAAKTAQQELANAFKQKAADRIQYIQSLIADARNVGVDTSRSGKLLARAQDEFDEGEYEASLKSVLISGKEIDQIKDLSSKSAIEIRVAKDRIRDAEAIGLDMTSPRTTLDQAIDALNSHKYAISFELSRKAGKNAFQIIKENLERIFEKISERVSSASGTGADINRTESLLEEARNSFNAMEFQDSIRYMMECEQELERADLQYDIAVNTLDVARNRLKEAEGDGLFIAKAKEILTDAESAMNEKRFNEVIELSISLGDEIERNTTQMESCHLDINALEERTERLARVGLEIDSAQRLLERAKEALQSADFVKCRETCIEGERAISVDLEEIINEKITEAERLIISAVSLGMDEREYRDILAVAQTSVDEGLWDFAFEEIQKCSAKVGDDIRGRLEKSINEMKSNITIVKKVGASVSALIERVHLAESKLDNGEFDEAFKIIMDSESLISNVESSHKDYIDAKYAAESAIAIARKYGIPTKESERLVDMAEIEAEKDYASAIELVHEASETARRSLDQFNPEIELSIQSSEMRSEQQGTIEIEVINRGKALAKDLELNISGDFEIADVPEIPPMRGGQSQKIELGVTPKRVGRSEISISIIAKRLFDGKSFEFSAAAQFNIIPTEPTAKLARSTENTKCSSCNGKIKPGFDIVICNKCNSIQHLACAKRRKRCGNCSAMLVFE